MSNELAKLSDVTNAIADRLHLTDNYLKLNLDRYTENYPVEVKERMDAVVAIVNSNTVLPELYGDILKEVSVGQSAVQSQAVQMEQHFTPHRKMRQIMLELDGKLGALDAAKNGHKQAVVKLHKLQGEIDRLQKIYSRVETTEDHAGELDRDTAILVCMIWPNLIPASVLSLITQDEPLKTPEVLDMILDKCRITLGEKLIKLEETDRGLRSHEHMVKDAAMESQRLQTLVEGYQKQMEETGWNFEESELYYYVMYFSKEGEQQIRTGGRVDTGTFGVVCTLPAPLQKKIIANWNFIKEQHSKNIDPNTGKDTFDGYYFQVYQEIMEPKWDPETRTFEGVSPTDFINTNVPHIIKKKTEE